TFPANFAPPRIIGEIPIDGRGEGVLKAPARPPADLALDFRRIDGIAEIVTRTIFHEADRFAIRTAVFARRPPIEVIANGRHHGEIAALIAASDIVALAGLPTLEHRRERHGV